MGKLYMHQLQFFLLRLKQQLDFTFASFSLFNFLVEATRKTRQLSLEE
jgi:hypothetical protein